MKAPHEKYAAEVASAKAKAETCWTTPEFRNYWLGFTEESRNGRAQQFRVFGDLVGSVTQSLCGWHILDVGCGDGRWLRFFLEYDAKPEDVVGVDVTDARFALGLPKNPLVRLVKTDGVTVPFPDNSFDLVTQFVTFSNIPTSALRRHVAAEIYRVLKKGGYVFWWDLPPACADTDRNATLHPSDYFDLPIRTLSVAPMPLPGECLRPLRGLRRWLAPMLNHLGHGPSHLAALIGPKP